VHPILFKIGEFEVTTFGAMVGVGALVGVWLFARELKRTGLPPWALNAAIHGLFAGFIGAKLLYVAEHSGEEPFASLLFSRGGLSWFGGLFGGVGAALVYLRWQRLPLVPVLAAATPGLAVGHLLGRIGCFLVGDDYGWPSSLPWAVAFPQGLPPTLVPVHPTQLYEAALLAPLAWLLIRWRRAGVPSRIVLGRYLSLTGVIRFGVEFLRVESRVALGFTVPQYGALLIVMAGLALLRPSLDAVAS
jgi:phosphatidylglycerol:prolipoprotein diacylglycerol transferase